MIQSILELFAWLGLDFLDYKHQKEISKQEKKDGVKRPFKKYFFQPSFKIFIFSIGLVCITSFLFFTYQKSFIFPARTKKEVSEIGNWIIKWREKYGNYPSSLTEIVGNSSMKKTWLKDAWGRDYEYSILNDNAEFVLKSSGKDGKFGTVDDIIFN